MKAFNYLVVAVFLGSTFFMTSCNSGSSGRLIKEPWVDTIKSGEGVSLLIDYIVYDYSHWSQDKFDSIADKISSLAAAGDLDKNILEDKSLKERLFDSSTALLKRQVDSVFKLSTYVGYCQMKDDLRFLQERNRRYYEAGLNINEKNQALAEIADIFENYEKVLNLSRNSFRQRAVYLRNYSLSYAYTKERIEENKYYSKYFCHNSEITGNVREFPNRVRQAKYDYLSALEDSIEQRALREGFTYERLVDDQSRFYEFAEGVNQAAIDTLKKFVDQYEEPVEEDSIANTHQEYEY